jgi:acylglycerol lipase
VIPRQPVAEFVTRLPADPRHQRRLAYYPHGYHLLLRDLDGATVTGDVASWVLDRAAPLPSRADAAEMAASWPPAPSGNG